MITLFNGQGLAPEETDILVRLEHLSDLNRDVLDQKINDLEEQLAGDEANYHHIWCNLKKDDFENKRSKIITDLYFLREKSIGLGISLPNTWENQRWTDSLAELRHKMTTLDATYQENSINLTNVSQHKTDLITEREALQAQKRDYDDEYNKMSKRVEEWITARGHLEVLHGYGLLEGLTQIDFIKLFDGIKQLRLRAEELSDELNLQLKEQAVHLNSEGNLENKREELKRLIKRRKIVENLQAKFRKLSPVATIEKSVWKEYDETISLLFRKLHWPPDFGRVRLKSTTNDLDLEIESRRKSNEWNPAHTRLSAGQRSALALSVFWAFNALPEIIPPHINHGRACSEY